MDTIVRLTETERGFLMLRDSQGQMVTRIARNWEQESINPSELTISRTVVARVINDGQPVLTTNAEEDPRFGGQESIVAYNLRSILCVPLKVKSELIGVIYTDNRIRTGIFAEAERDLLGVFANQAAVAIENARLFASVRRYLLRPGRLYMSAGYLIVQLDPFRGAEALQPFLQALNERHLAIPWLSGLILQVESAAQPQGLAAAPQILGQKILANSNAASTP